MDRRQFLSVLTSSKPIAASADPSLDRWIPTDQNPWDRSAVKHLCHRLGIPASKQWIDYALSMGPHEYIDLLMHESLVHELLPDPPEGWELWLTVPPYNGTDPKVYEHQDDIYHMAKMDIRNQWAQLMAIQQPMFREKMALFWSNHFVIQEQKVFHTQQVHRYLAYLRKNVWGNFKQMVHDITIQPAMLVYLDNVWNEKDKLNENYARELMELFTMGITDKFGNPNYTQQDVRDVALAITGWRFRYESPAPNVLEEYFAWYYFDYDTKTRPWGTEPKIYGLKASHDPKVEADIIDTMFEVRGHQIAWHMCKKFYEHFIHRDSSGEVQHAIIDQMAARFMQDWEVKPVLEMLLRSKHFFDPILRGSIVKSPHEFMLGAMNQLGVGVTQSRGGTLAWQGVEMNQWLLDPVNVKGWPGHRTWLTSGTLSKRVDFLNRFIVGDGVESHYIDAHTGNGYEWIHWSNEEVIAHASRYPSNRTDIAAFMRELSETFYAIELQPEQIEEILVRIVTFPRYEWPSLTDEQRVPILRRLTLALMLQPEYQIC